ncbi:MAG TPA: hypothetical protein VGX76_05690 [Pirellulales bacterium]|jgi:hypothetical protein|nr:hypothetical protein [Pirellulales bacterium]
MSKRIPLAAVVLLALLDGARAQDAAGDYTQGGVTYRTVRVPRTQIQCVERPTTYLQERYDVQYRDTYRIYHLPVTEYRWEPRWRGRFNPFVQPSLTYRYVPRTHWETRTEVNKMPVTTRQLVPVTTTVRVPITTETFEDQVVAVRGRAPASDPFASPAPMVAGNQSVGGQARYDRGDPPRRGLVDVNSSAPAQLANGAAASAPAARTANATQWRTVPSTRQ